MAKVTSKRQITIPKAITDHYRIHEGDDLEFVAAGDAIRVIPTHARRVGPSIAERLRTFDAVTRRQEERTPDPRGSGEAETDRGWTRDELYEQ